MTIQTTCVYLLRSLTDNSFYLGSTVNLPRRLAEHNAGTVRYTQDKRPWEVVAYEIYTDAHIARLREQALKHHSRMRHFFIKRALAVPLGSAMGGPRQVGG